MSNAHTFEMREYTRPATDEEQKDLVQRLLKIRSEKTQTQSEKKAAMANFKEILETLEEREEGICWNLQNGTYNESVEVDAVINESTGHTQYFTRVGDLVPELTHPTSRKDKEADAQRKQLAMFGEAPTSPDDNPVPFDVPGGVTPDHPAPTHEQEVADRLDDLATDPRRSYKADVAAFEAGAVTHSVDGTDEGIQPEKTATKPVKLKTATKRSNQRNAVRTRPAKA